MDLLNPFVREGLLGTFIILEAGVIMFLQRQNNAKDSLLRESEARRVDDIKQLTDVVLARIDKIQDSYVITLDRLKEIGMNTLTIVQALQSVILRK